MLFTKVTKDMGVKCCNFQQLGIYTCFLDGKCGAEL